MANRRKSALGFPGFPGSLCFLGFLVGDERFLEKPNQFLARGSQIRLSSLSAERLDR
jgi:hypothetical protein